VNDIDPEISELLELLNAREQFDEIAQLFEHSLFVCRTRERLQRAGG
jgi:hypothetical protein